MLYPKIPYTRVRGPCKRNAMYSAGSAGEMGFGTPPECESPDKIRTQRQYSRDELKFRLAHLFRAAAFRNADRVSTSLLGD